MIVFVVVVMIGQYRGRNMPIAKDVMRRIIHPMKIGIEATIGLKPLKPKIQQIVLLVVKT